MALKFRRSSDSDLYCRSNIQETAGEFQEPELQLPWTSPLDRCGEYVEAYSVKTTSAESGFWSQSGPSELGVAEEGEYSFVAELHVPKARAVLHDKKI